MSLLVRRTGAGRVLARALALALALVVVHEQFRDSCGDLAAELRQSLVEKLGVMLDDERMCDIDLVAGDGGIVRAHRIVLSSWSSELNELCAVATERPHEPDDAAEVEAAVEKGGLNGDGATAHRRLNQSPIGD